MNRRTTVAALVAALITLVAVPIFWYGREGQGDGASRPQQDSPAGRADGVPGSPRAVPGSPDPAATPGAPATVGARPAGLPTATSTEAVPLELIVADADLRVPVVPTGIAKDGQMELPPNPARIGWYKFGPAPSAAQGSVVLGGHLDSREYGVGPLARLGRTRPGDLIELRLSDGKTLRYRTEAVRNVDKQALALDVVFDRTGPRRLQLVTCGGDYIPERGGYQENLVVTAVPAG